jgi:NitT/TauT family transport system permease protein
MAVAQAMELESAGPAAPPRWWLILRQGASFAGILLTLCLLWEGYKAFGAMVGGAIPLPVRPDDNSMPHVWTILDTLFQPVRRGSEEILLAILARAALFTWREAAVGFLAGSLIGFGLGAVFGRFTLFERSLMPYIVASQTVPLLAIAPMVVIWGGRLGWEAWWSVSIISAYLTFFPVTINTLRGLRSPHPTAVELMRSYAASEMQILWKLRLPAALPYIFTALKVSATASVIGAIVGELPSGIPDGLGRILLNFAQYFSTGPERLFAAVLGAAALGILFAALVGVAERLILPEKRRLSE